MFVLVYCHTLLLLCLLDNISCSVFTCLSICHFYAHKINILLLSIHHQTPHPGRIEHAHSVLQQHSSGVHGNQSLGDAGSPLPQRNANTQNSRLQSEGSFGLGGPGAPGGEGADHALDVSGWLLIMCSLI